MSDLVRWALIILGAVYLVTEATISAGPRVAIARLHPLAAAGIYCPACVGFWAGLWLHRFWGPFWTIDAALGSSLGAMALGAAWASWRGGNAAWEAEAELRDPSPPSTPDPEPLDDEA